MMNVMARIECTTELAAELVRPARALLWRVFDDMTEHDWQHCLGGGYVLAWDGAELVGFAAVRSRRLLHGDRPVRTGYVEGMAVAASYRRRGIGGRIMAEVECRIRADYELGALGSSDEGFPFYRHRGWQVWRGRTFVRTRRGPVRTAEEEGSILVYPSTFPLDLSADLSCEERAGEPW